MPPERSRQRLGREKCLCRREEILALFVPVSMSFVCFSFAAVDDDPHSLLSCADEGASREGDRETNKETIVQQTDPQESDSNEEEGVCSDAHFNRPTLHFHRPPLLIFFLGCITRSQPPTPNQRPPPSLFTQTPIGSIPIPDRNLKHVQPRSDD